DANYGILVYQHRWLHEPAILIFLVVEAVASADQSGALVFPDVHVAPVGLQLGFVDGRTHVHILIEAVADFETLGPVHVAFDEFVVDSFLHDDAAGGGATLASSAEAAPESALDGEVEVGIVEHDHRVLAAEFEGTMLERFGCSGADDPSHLRRAGQGYSAYLRL